MSTQFDIHDMYSRFDSYNQHPKQNFRKILLYSKIKHPKIELVGAL